jgi:hypothetical protein
MSDRSLSSTSRCELCGVSDLDCQANCTDRLCPSQRPWTPAERDERDEATREIARRIAERSGGTVVEHKHHYTIVRGTP